MMKYRLLRHFHSVGDEVSKHGYQQFESVFKYLTDSNIKTLVATSHPRVLASARLLEDSLPLKLVVLNSDANDCVAKLRELDGVLLISQQPILKDVSEILTGRNFQTSRFLTGSLVEI